MMTATLASWPARTAMAVGALCGCSAWGAPAQDAPAPHVYGRFEHALVMASPTIQVRSQLDGGGEATVLYVTNIKYAHGEGGMFVHFTIDNGEVMPGKTVDLALPVLQDRLVRAADGSMAHQPLVDMQFCIGAVAFGSHVVLKPRSSYIAPLLLGKADAAQFGPVDPQKKNTGDPACAPVATR